MKNSTMRWMIAAAALVVVAGSASAQSYKAEIPMAFRVGDTLLQPGSYEISKATGSSRVVFLRNTDTHRSIAMLPGVPADAPKAWVREGKPKIGFECSGARCTLSRIWDGQETFAHNFNVRKLPAMEAQRVEDVTLAMVRVR